MKHEDFMREAIRLSIDSVKNGGGPFGAVVVRDGKIIARGSNRVTMDNDPTAHAEVVAIRNATKELDSFDLSDCDIYASCEPCPMCLGAVYWSRFRNLYFANTKNDAKDIGFDDSFIYDEIQTPYEKRKITTHTMLREEALEAFNLWNTKEDKIEY